MRTARRLTPPEVEATLELIRAIPGARVPTELETAATQIAALVPGVVISGHINRGKSTLFNRLVGAEVSPTAARPETAITITARSGEPAASGTLASGQAIELPSAPAEFREAVRRSGAVDGLVRAEITGAFRLPDGLVLIDSPGLAEATDDGELERRWKATGAGAALFTVGVPPGLDQSDRDSIDLFEQHFPGRFHVVLQAVQRSIEDSDLDECAEYMRSFGIDPHRPGSETPRGGWGRDPAWAPIEQLISSLFERAAAGRDRLVAGYVELVEDESRRLDERVVEAADRGWIHPLRDAEARPHADPRLLEAIDGVAERLDALEAAARRRELEERVVEIAPRLREDLAGHVQDRVTSPTLRSWFDELTAAASDGSPMAIAELDRLVIAAPRSLTLVSDRSRFIGLLSSERAITVAVENLAPRADDLRQLFRASGDGLVRSAAIRGLAAGLRTGEFTQLRDLEFVLEHAPADLALKTLRAVELAACRRLLEAAETHAPTVEQFVARVGSARDQVEAIVRARLGASAEIVRAAGSIHDTTGPALARGEEAIALATISLAINHMSEPIENAVQWSARQRWLAKQVDTVRVDRLSPTVRGSFGEWTYYAIAAGPLYKDESTRALARCHALASERLTWIARCRVGSFALWGASVAAAITSFGVGFMLWLVSFVVWIYSLANQDDSRPDSQKYYRLVAPHSLTGRPTTDAHGSSVPVPPHSADPPQVIVPTALAMCCLVGVAVAFAIVLLGLTSSA